MKKRKKKRLILIPVYLTIVLLGTAFAAYGIKEYNSQNKMAEVQAAAKNRKLTRKQASTKSDEPVMILPRFRDLAAKNPDLVGWLSIPDTVVDYPVMYKTGDNDFYLTHDFEGNEDQNGLLVLDKRCVKKGNDTNNLIHGHNMKTGVMFGALLDYTKKSFWMTHQTITFSSLYEEHTYEIVGVFRSSVYDEQTDDFDYYNYISIESKEQFNEYIQGVKERSLYDTGVTAFYGDRLITLSTCESSKENGRLVVVARSRS